MSSAEANRQMKVVSNVALPKVFWVSIDPDNPVAQLNAVQIGTISSAAFSACGVDQAVIPKYMQGTLEYLRFVENANADVPVISQHFLTVTNDYLVEYNAEVARRQLDPLLPSRLSAVYAFGRKKDAVAAARRARRPIWNVHAFELIEAPLTRVHRANMEVVSVMRTATRNGTFAPSELDAIWRHYWSGGEEITIEFTGADQQRRLETTGITWEYLIEGALKKLERRH